MYCLKTDKLDAYGKMLIITKAIYCWKYKRHKLIFHWKLQILTSRYWDGV